MQAVIAHSLTLVLFVHALLGCCWHHAHGCVQCESTPGQGSKLIACCHHHQEEGEQDQQPASPCKCRAECAGVCSYLPPQKTQVDFARVLFPFDHVAVLPTAAQSCGSPASTWELACGPVDLKPPLRLHLLQQVLLI